MGQRPANAALRAPSAVGGRLADTRRREVPAARHNVGRAEGLGGRAANRHIARGDHIQNAPLPAVGGHGTAVGDEVDGAADGDDGALREKAGGGGLLGRGGVLLRLGAQSLVALAAALGGRLRGSGGVVAGTTIGSCRLGRGGGVCGLQEDGSSAVGVLSAELLGCEASGQIGGHVGKQIEAETLRRGAATDRREFHGNRVLRVGHAVRHGEGAEAGGRADNGGLHNKLRLRDTLDRKAAAAGALKAKVITERREELTADKEMVRVGAEANGQSAAAAAGAALILLARRGVLLKP